MQYDLEDILFDKAINNAGITYSDFRKTLTPFYSNAWIDIAKGYFVILIASMILLFFQISLQLYWWLIIPLSSCLIGYTLSYLALFIHEAGHYNLSPNRKTNDVLATIFLCLPFGLSLKSYRKIHWQHHLHLGTTKDTETSYVHPLTKLFLLESFTGIHLLRTMRKKNTNTLLTNDQLDKTKLYLAAGILFHTIIITIALLFSKWLFVLSWIIAFATFFPFFATLRQLLEHRDELANAKIDYAIQPHGKFTRLFVHTILSSSFGSAGFTRHLIHHWDPQISYTRLQEIEKFLFNCEIAEAFILQSKTTYFKTFKKLYEKK